MNTKLRLTAPIYSESLEIMVPAAIITPSDTVYFWTEADGCFTSADGQVLYIEPDDHDGTLSADSFYEEP